MSRRGFPPDCKLPPELKKKGLDTNPSYRRYGTCKWCSKLSETRDYCAVCPRARTIRPL